MTIPSRTKPMSDLTERLQLVREGLLTGLIERDVAVRLALAIAWKALRRASAAPVAPKPWNVVAPVAPIT